MLVSHWTWTDRRDGTHWTVSGVLITPNQCLGPLLFRANDASSLSASCGVVSLDDAELQSLLDEARAVRLDRELERRRAGSAQEAAF